MPTGSETCPNGFRLILEKDPVVTFHFFTRPATKSSVYFTGRVSCVGNHAFPDKVLDFFLCTMMVADHAAS